MGVAGVGSWIFHFQCGGWLAFVAEAVKRRDAVPISARQRVVFKVGVVVAESKRVFVQVGQEGVATGCELEIIAQNIPINIIYEDDDLLLVNKTPDMVVHPGYANYTGTLLNALTYHLQQTDKREGVLPYLCHRIDKNTSGILLIAKNELTQQHLARQFFEHTIQRKYIALVWGDFKEDEGTIEGNIGRNPLNRRMMTVFPDGDAGKEAITHYKVIEKFGYVSLIECQLETGRTHQIRTHLKFIGHPVFNDETYGGDIILKGTTFSKYKQYIDNCFKLLPRHALHAKSLGFIHPTTGKYIFFDSELPDDMQSVIDKWRKYSSFNELDEE